MILSNKSSANKVFEAIRALQLTHPRLAKDMERKIDSVLYPEKMLDILLEQMLVHDIEEHFESVLGLELYPGRAERVLKNIFEFAIKNNFKSDEVLLEGFNRKLEIFAKHANPYLSAEEAIMRSLRSEMPNHLWIHFWKDLNQESLNHVLSYALLKGDVEFTRHVLQANALLPPQMLSVLKLIKNGSYNHNSISQKDIQVALHSYDELLYKEVMLNDTSLFRESFWSSLLKNKKDLPQTGNFVESKRLKEKIQIQVCSTTSKSVNNPNPKLQRF